MNAQLVELLQNVSPAEICAVAMASGIRNPSSSRSVRSSTSSKVSIESEVLSECRKVGRKS